MYFIKKASSRVICSDGQSAIIKSTNSLVKLSPAKQIYARSHSSHREGGQIVLIPFSHQFSHSWHFLADRQPWRPASSTNFTQRFTEPCRSQSPNQASFSKNLKCRFFMNYCSWSNRRPFSLEEALQLCGLYKEQQQNSSFVFPL